MKDSARAQNKAWSDFWCKIKLSLCFTREKTKRSVEINRSVWKVVSFLSEVSQGFKRVVCIIVTLDQFCNTICKCKLCTNICIKKMKWIVWWTKLHQLFFKKPWITTGHNFMSLFQSTVTSHCSFCKIFFQA